MGKTSIMACVAVVVLAVMLGGCLKSSSSLTAEERSTALRKITALEPIAAVHKGKKKLAVSTDAVLNEFKRATGHRIRTVERSGLQQLLDQQALQELDIFGGASSDTRKKVLSKAKGLLYHTVSAVDENRLSAKLTQKWVVTGSVHIVNVATGETVYHSNTIKAGGKKTLQESIQKYANEMGDRLRRDFRE